MKWRRLICLALLWHRLVRPIELPQWHSNAKRYGRRCKWCGAFESHPWFTE